MWDASKRSVLNGWCQSHDHQNLFVVRLYQRGVAGSHDDDSRVINACVRVSCR